LVSFAGPFSNLVIAFIVAVPMRLVLSSPELSRTVLFESEILGLIFDVGVLLLTLNILLFVFNLIPVPPLDGWRVLMGIVPSDVAYRMRELELRYANVIPMIFMGVIFIMLFSGATFLGQIIRFIRDLLLGI
jgi:Zn-dependent protease